MKARPLEHTDVEARIDGMVARVGVTQTFRNPYDKPIEAVYVFPLPPLTTPYCSMASLAKQLFHFGS